MDSRPCHERRQPAQLHLAGLQDGEFLTDDRHVPPVEVSEGCGYGLTDDAVCDQSGNITSLLQRDLRHPGERLAVLFEVSGIPDREYLGPSAHAEVGLHRDPSSEIGRASWRERMVMQLVSEC